MTSFDPQHTNASMKRRGSRAIIGVSTQTLQSIDGIPAGLPHSVVMNQRYYIAAALHGCVRVLWVERGHEGSLSLGIAVDGRRSAVEV